MSASVDTCGRYNGGKYQVFVRVFTEIDTKDYPFEIMLDPYGKGE